MQNEMEKGRAKETLTKFARDARYIIGRTVLGTLRGVFNYKTDPVIEVRESNVEFRAAQYHPVVESQTDEEARKFPPGFFTDRGFVEATQPAELAELGIEHDQENPTREQED